MQKIKHYIGALRYDLPSSVVVFLVALPLCLGIALGSGAPLFSGIIAGMVGGIVIGAFSGSQLSVSGPAAGLSTIVAAAILKLDVYEAFLVAVVLGGIFQIILGFLKAGILGDYIPSSVIKGMLAAIGVILILKQFPHLVGYDANPEGDETFSQTDGDNTFSGLYDGLRHLLPGALIIGLISLAIMVIWENVVAKKAKFLQMMPAPLIVVAVGIIINETFKTSSPAFAIKESHLVSIPVATSVNGFVSFFTFPDFSHIFNYNIWLTGFTIAIVASLETLLNIEAADDLDPYQRVTPTNRELMAQGAGNMISGLIGGLPITSVVVRTSANINAGARTKMSAIFHGVLLLLSVAFIPKLLNLIPLSALAAILIYTGYKLAKPSLFVNFYKKGWDVFVPFVLTIVAILLTDLLKGILIGCVVGMFFVI